uniref:TYR_PHOSPHATASE_2 domain-containing protein n=1 Tax=Strongyloides papillosus TaxID=174720 RepID=A0A0N5BV70_STREA
MLGSEGEENKFWVRYLPNEVNESQNYNEYCVIKLRNIEVIDDNNFCGGYYSIGKENGTVKNFSNLHFKGWTNHGIPKNFVKVYKLYRMLMESNPKQPILIHCPNGVTRTGTLALIIHIIDTINEFHSFNPLNNLTILRRHRYGAVPGIDQFMLCLGVVYEHFNQELMKSEKQIYKKFLEIYDLLLIEK